MDKEKSAKNIIFLPKWYPNYHDSLNGIFVQRHANEVATFANVHVVFSTYREEQKKLICYECQETEGVKEHLFYYKKRITGIGLLDKLIKLFLWFYTSSKGVRLAKKELGSIDFIHVHVLLRTGLLALWNKLTKGIPYGITEHWTIYLPQNASKFKWWRKYLSKKVFRKAEFLSTVSLDLEQAITQFHRIKTKNTFRLSNSVDTQVFNYNQVEESPYFDLLHVSEFNEEAKNIKGILDTLKKVIEQDETIRLNLVGYGKDEDLILEHALKIGLTEKNFIFKGKLVKEQLAREFQQANTFVLFSNFENQPCVILEALCCGLPVISSNVGGIPETINTDNGLLMDPKDELSLEQSILSLKGNYKNYNRSSIAEKAQKFYSNEAVIEQLKACYQVGYHHV